MDGGVVIYAAFNKWMVDVDNYARRNIASAVEEFISLQHNYALITGGKFYFLNCESYLDEGTILLLIFVRRLLHNGTHQERRTPLFL